MAIQNLGIIPLKTVSLVAKLGFLSPECVALAERATSTDELVCKLGEQNRWNDAVKLLPYLLPTRQAVWWACLCVWQALRPEAADDEELALAVAVCWVLLPREFLWKAASPGLPAATSVRYCIKAIAAAGFLEADDGAAEPHDPWLAARMVQAAVIEAFHETRNAGIDAEYRDFVRLGLQVAKGELDWNGPLAAARG